MGPHLKRRQSWPEDLARHISACKTSPFEWGRHDCCVFAADCVLAMTGVDLMADLRGAYDSEKTARAILKKHKGLQSMVSDRLGDPKPRTLAQRGDVVLFDGDNGLTLGVCVGSMICGPADQGVGFVPLSCGIAAWGV